MWFLKKKSNDKLPEDFIGPIYEKTYRHLIKKDKKQALPYIRRAALLLFPLKPELWSEYITLKKEILQRQKPKKVDLSKIKDEMEGL